MLFGLAWKKGFVERVILIRVEKERERERG